MIKIMSTKKIHLNNLYKILNISNSNDLKNIAKTIGVKSGDLEFFNNNMIFPNGTVLGKILDYTGYSEFELKLRLGILESDVVQWISNNPELLLDAFKDGSNYQFNEMSTIYKTELGKLYQGDCLELMKQIPSNSIDCIFADPPFNLNKKYDSGIDDNLSEQHYLEWTEKWLLECVRILAPGGSLFVYNIPYWSTHIAHILNKYLTFRHWISISMKGLIPVANRLHPSHYALLYYVKGEHPKVFNKQRIPMNTCRHCGGEVHDYGGKKKTLSPSGLSISDIWTDINPVRHKKFKNRDANELPVKLLHRVISLATNEGDVVFDPFGGSGTTYAVAELLHRRWIGIEIGEVDTIINRIDSQSDLDLLNKVIEESNVLFTKDQIEKRNKSGFWTFEVLESKLD